MLQPVRLPVRRVRPLVYAVADRAPDVPLAVSTLVEKKQQETRNPSEPKVPHWAVEHVLQLRPGALACLRVPGSLGWVERPLLALYVKPGRVRFFPRGPEQVRCWSWGGGEISFWLRASGARHKSKCTLLVGFRAKRGRAADAQEGPPHTLEGRVAPKSGPLTVLPRPRLCFRQSRVGGSRCSGYRCVPSPPTAGGHRTVPLRARPARGSWNPAEWCEWTGVGDFRRREPPGLYRRLRYDSTPR
ncbi:hypothetical protein NDU88_000605 [Pleurodeles waltl]|uniref:Uncharacterized protein n=1 Tax=Pleurodeles waltl TaxID=8319 RepID=A0AAV7V8V9_PLEWA|nr:hypothetical protein NDU88_000605 [Pleurodeles waltl]